MISACRLLSACENSSFSFNCLRLVVTILCALCLMIYMVTLLFEMRRQYQSMNGDIFMIYISFFQCICQIVTAFYQPLLILLYLGLFIEILQFTYMSHFMGKLVYRQENQDLKYYSLTVVAMQALCCLLGIFYGKCLLSKDYPMLVMQTILILQFIVFMLWTYRIISQLNANIRGTHQNLNYELYRTQRANIVRIAIYYLLSVSFHLIWNLFFELGMDSKSACLSNNEFDDTKLTFQIFLFVKQLLYMLPFLFLGFVFRLSIPPKTTNLKPSNSMHEAFFSKADTSHFLEHNFSFDNE